MINQAEHLSQEKIVNQGSFYTPDKYVLMAAEWLQKHHFNELWTIADTSCGYGAFFQLHKYFPGCRYIGNDFDSAAVETAKRKFPFIESSNINALHNVAREMFNLGSDRLCIVGNPPYNDVTSQIGRNIKTDKLEIDRDIFTRDLGLSFLNSYAKLGADYVLILHPLSYLIKKQNFSAARHFFNHYKIVESIVFSSHEFADTSRSGEFPIVMVLYESAVLDGLTYDSVQYHEFKTIEGTSFCVNKFDYVKDYIHKYPGSVRYDPEILFYTMRDINALKRSRTFIQERCANAVDVDPSKIAYYCYIDLFKKFAAVPYWMGNFDVPFNAELFSRFAGDFIAVSKSLHPDIFGDQPNPSEDALNRIKKYINDVLDIER